MGEPRYPDVARVPSWATRDDMEQLYGDTVAVWRDWADSVGGVAIDRVGLCQPLPVTDAGHLSHHTGRKC